MASSSSNNLRTYIAGEDDGRLAASALDLGLSRQRIPLQPVRDRNNPIDNNMNTNATSPRTMTSWLFDSTATAARMHSVGALGQDERVDGSGTLHLYSLRRSVRTSTTNTRAKPSYGALQDLFHQKDATTTTEEGENEDEDDDDEEEIIIEDVIEGGSLNAAVFGIIKGTVGPAILYLPRGFQTSGYAVAIPAMLVATATYIFNANRLLECWKVESERNHRTAARMEGVRALLLSNTNNSKSPNDSSALLADDGEGDTAASSFLRPALLSYPELARRAFGEYSLLVELGIASMQFGVCLTYLIFVPQNLRECVLGLFGMDVSKSAFLVAMVLIEIPLSWIRDIRKLTPTNVIATILIAYGLCSVLSLALAEGLEREEEGDGEMVFQSNLATLPAVTDTWFVFVGTSFFMMEGSITLLVPLQEAVFREEDKVRFPKINQLVTSWIVVFYIIFSVVCVAAFGDGIRTALTASLTGRVAYSVQLAYSLAVILTFPLQAFPAMEVACKAILPRRREERADSDNVKRSVLATTLTLLLGVIAVCAIDYLGNVVSILGSLFGIPLALIFPPLMHNVLVKESTNGTRIINKCVVCVGFLAMGAASYATIISWDQGAEDG